MEANIKTKKFGVGDLLVEGWRILIQEYKNILMIILCINLPINILMAVNSNELLVKEDGLQFLGILIQLLLSVLMMLATLSIVIVVDRAVEGQSLPWTEAILQALSKWGKAFWTGLLAGVLIMLGTLIFIIPGLIISVYCMFATYVVVLRNESGTKALGYSKSLVQGQWWRMFGISLLLGIIIAIVAMAIMFPLSLIVNLTSFSPYWNIIPTTLVSVVSSFNIITMVLLFLNTDYIYSAGKVELVAPPVTTE
jgi:hypothetical protein